MADSNRSRDPALSDLADDDPLRELARIMGHDSQPQAEKKPAAAFGDEADADLEIDLEGELLGELSSWNDEANAGTGDETEGRPAGRTAGDPGDRIGKAGRHEGQFSAVPGEGEYGDPAAGQAVAASDDASDGRFDESHETAAANHRRDEAASDEAADPLAPLFSDIQPATEPGPTDPDPAEGDGATGDEPFDYSRAATERHDILAGTLAPTPAETATGAAGQPSAAETPGGSTEDTTSRMEGYPPRAERATLAPDTAASEGAGDPLGVFGENERRSVRTPTTATAAPAYGQGADDGPSTFHGRSEAVAGDGPPEVDTVDIQDSPAALPDDLDIPEVEEEPDVLPAAELDDFEAELAGAFGSLGDDAVEQESADDDTDEQTAKVDEASAAAISAATAASADYSYRAAEQLRETFSQPVDGSSGYGQAREFGAGEGQQAESDGPEGSDFYFDPALDEEMASPRGVEGTGNSRRRAWLVAGFLAIIAVGGGIGAFALSPGGGDTGSPALVKADEGPVKVKPENPGGTKVPNQDGEVYRRVAGKDTEAPTQAKLVSSAEEPVDLAPADGPRKVTAEAVSQEADAPAKSEQRLAPTPAEEGSQVSNEVTALQPRRVKTVVVKPDGTIVQTENAQPREQAAAGSESERPDERAATAADQTIADQTIAGEASENTDAPVSTGAEAPSAAQASDADAATGETVAATDLKPVASSASSPVDENADSSAAAMPEAAPIPTARPTTPKARSEAEAPRVASREPARQAARETTQAPAAAASSAWSVQIASQPTVKGAQQSYQNLAQRYGDLLSGRGVNIVRAEIDGKGTYYRVRIPSASKQDAISLCSRLKDAGGNCFVSK